MTTEAPVINQKPHLASRDSGAAWYGNVPDHWETRKLRNILSSTTERNRPDLPLLSIVREQGVILRDIDNTDENHNVIPEDLTNYKVVRIGQFAMNKMKSMARLLRRFLSTTASSAQLTSPST